jgi:hypothetical protein
MSGFYEFSNKDLISLIEIFPKKIEGDLYLWENNLTSLKGSPIFVSCSFICSINKLTTLLYFPKIVKELVHVDANNLLGLDYIPQLSCDDPSFPLFINY